MKGQAPGAVFASCRPRLGVPDKDAAGSNRAPHIRPPRTPSGTSRRPRSGVQKTGGVLLSRALAGQVPSALRGLTALFGMGRGVSPSLWPPEIGRDQLSTAL